jgi:glycosyltransferase involved in cell wall biosynthesis
MTSELTHLHLLFVTGEYPPMQGGVGAYTAELGAALQALDCRVSVLTSTQGARSDLTATGERTERVACYPVIPQWGWGTARAVAHWADRLQVDWIHVQYQTAAYAMHPAINFAPQSWRRRWQVAWTYHDLLPMYLFPKAGRWLRRWMTERPGLYSDLTVVTNEGDRLQLAGRAPCLAKIPIGSNIAGGRATAGNRAARRRKRSLPAEGLVVGYFGFLNRSKGGLTLIETLARLVQSVPDARLLMIGEQVGASDPSNYAYLQEVEARIAALGLQDRVSWTGRQSESEVSADLAAIDLLLMPYEDGASLRRGTLMAGLAHGCAIVTTYPQAPLPELLEGRDLLYVPPGDGAAMAAAVLHLWQKPEVYAALRAAAFAASRHFTWPEIGRQHLQHYQTIKRSATQTGRQHN